jgi:Zn-dependent protease with chaperone function
VLAFLVKGLFKQSGDAPNDLYELKPEQQPALFAFLRRLAHETRAPMPRRVYVTHQVNAAVISRLSFWNLFVSPKRDLLLGLGLVNALSLSELKAVVAHELGHFSQRTSRVGNYVYVANRVIVGMLERDRWDQFLEDWKRADLRIGVFGWLVHGLVWVMRKLLALAFKGINLLHASLSRQMEFDADRVAVRVAGSDAITHALHKLSFADASLQQGLVDLTHAADHGLYSRDLFVHQTHAGAWLRRLRRDPALGVTPPLPDTERERHRVFKDAAGVTPSMWSSHPPSEEREANAKATYVPCALDDRPAWTLFQTPDTLREAVTLALLAPRVPQDRSFSSPEEVQRFIDAEHEETTFDARYHDMYEGRTVRPGDIDAVASALRAAAPPVATLRADYATLWDDTLKKHMSMLKDRGDEAIRLMTLLGDNTFGATAQFRGRTIKRDEARSLVEGLETEREKLFSMLHERDARVFAVHCAMAQSLGDDDELLTRYRFHLRVQATAERMRTVLRTADESLTPAAQGRAMSEVEVDTMFTALNDARDTLATSLHALREVPIPAMKNVDAGTMLGPFLLASPVIEGGEVARREGVPGVWIQALFAQYQECLDKCVRLHFKSIGGILALQESIATRWHDANAA